MARSKLLRVYHRSRLEFLFYHFKFAKNTRINLRSAKDFFGKFSIFLSPICVACQCLMVVKKKSRQIVVNKHDLKVNVHSYD